TQRSKDDLGTVISASAKMLRKTEREIPCASSGPTRRAISSRWLVDNSVDGYLLFLIMGSSYHEQTQFHPDCWIWGQPFEECGSSSPASRSGSPARTSDALDGGPKSPRTRF